MATVSEYRGIGFSITPLGDYHWRWALHPPKQNEADEGTRNPVDFGDLFGTHGEAEAAAKKAIDGKLADSATS